MGHLVHLPYWFCHQLLLQLILYRHLNKLLVGVLVVFSELFGVVLASYELGFRLVQSYQLFPQLLWLFAIDGMVIKKVHSRNTCNHWPSYKLSSLISALQNIIRPLCLHFPVLRMSQTTDCSCSFSQMTWWIKWWVCGIIFIDFESTALLKLLL